MNTDGTSMKQTVAVFFYIYVFKNIFLSEHPPSFLPLWQGSDSCAGENPAEMLAVEEHVNYMPETSTEVRFHHEKHQPVLCSYSPKYRRFSPRRLDIVMLVRR